MNMHVCRANVAEIILNLATVTLVIVAPFLPHQHIEAISLSLLFVCFFPY